MGKYIDELEKAVASGSNRVVTEQELLNILVEYLSETTEMLREARLAQKPRREEE